MRLAPLHGNPDARVARSGDIAAPLPRRFGTRALGRRTTGE